MKFGQGMSADSVEYGMTRGEYLRLRGDVPRPDPVTRLVEAIRDAPGREWMTKAACKGVTGMFYPEDKDRSNYTAAKKLCATCPVVAECAEAGKDEVHGVWGGMSPRERRNLRVGKPRGDLKSRATALELARLGLSDRAVEERTGIPRRNVQHWRRVEGMIRDTHGRIVA